MRKCKDEAWKGWRDRQEDGCMEGRMEGWMG